MNAQCAQLKNFNATTQAQKDQSAGIIRNARKVSSSLENDMFYLIPLICSEHKVEGNLLSSVIETVAFYLCVVLSDSDLCIMNWKGCGMNQLWLILTLFLHLCVKWYCITG